MARENRRKGAPFSKRGAIDSAIAQLTHARAVGSRALMGRPAQRSAARPFSKRHFAFESLETRLALTANVVINEFLRTTLRASSIKIATIPIGSS